DVGGGEADAEVLSLDVFARSRRREGDAGRSGGRVELDPAVATAEGNVRALLKADLLVELDRTVLVARRDHHEADRLYAGRCRGHAASSGRGLQRLDR